MDILLLSNIIPADMEKEVCMNSKNTMQDAAISLQNRMIAGIEKNKNVKLRIINRLPVYSYPRHYKKPVIHTSYFSYNGEKEKKDVNLGFVNVCYIKHLLKSFSVKKHIKKWICESREKPSIVVYTLDKEFLKAVKYAKKINTDVKSCVVVADLPEYIDLSSNISLARKIYSWYSVRSLKRLYKYIDSYVLLTEQMAEKLGVSTPYTVVEGIATDTFGDICKNNADGLKTIFYAGTLHKKFGILNLLDAFNLIEDKSYRLVICGVGDSQNIVKERAEKDDRIKFCSILPREEVLDLMQQATVIVNPRQNNEEFTKYSFPSKNLEALSSGIPLVAYKLDGIPDEYDEHIFYVDGNTPEDLSKKLTQVCEMPEEERRSKAESARRFVHENKNSAVQAKRIIGLINSL